MIAGDRRTGRQVFWQMLADEYRFYMLIMYKYC